MTNANIRGLPDGWGGNSLNEGWHEAREGGPN